MAPNILIFGTGAVGTVYAHLLHRAGANVTVVCRSNYDAVTAHGLTLTSARFGHLHFRPATLPHIAAAANHPWDFLLVTTKAHPDTPALLRPALAPTTTIALLQNGIDIEPPYRALYPSNPLISAVVYIPATQTSPAHTHHANVERLILGPFPAPAPSTPAEELTRLLCAGGSTAECVPDVQPARWAKLAINATWNSLAALTRLSSAALPRASPDAEALMRATYGEVVAVAHAAGHAGLRADGFDEHVARTAGLGASEPSMLTDVRAGRRLEVEAVVGNVVAVAERLGVDVPRLRVLGTLLGMLNCAVEAGTLETAGGMAGETASETGARAEEQGSVT